ncbi:hypothetical protein KAU45_09765 [bacterium]|nr:hypothetical protein [bacterium]
MAKLGPLRLAVLEKSRFARAIDTLGRPFSLGLTGFDAFTWAGTVYLAERMFGNRSGYLLLRHEAVHLTDQRRVGLVPFILSYLILLPFGVTSRALWEWRGYRETLRAYWERGSKLAGKRAGNVLREFAGKRYLFMWPFKGMVERWIGRELKRLDRTGGRAYPGMERLGEAFAKAPQSEKGKAALGPPTILD